MPKTITLDNVQLVQMTIMREPNGDLNVFGEYAIRAGNVVVSSKHVQFNTTLGQARKASLQAVFDQVAQDIAAIELT